MFVRTVLTLGLLVLWVAPAAGEGGVMVHLGGTPEEVGATWGQINGATIRHEMENRFLRRASGAGVSEEQLVERSAVFVEIVERIAPHWLEEARAIARAAEVDEDLYVAFYGTQARSRFLHECTSYAVSRAHTEGDSLLFHKTRDNVDLPQSAFIVDSALDGVQKFIAVYNASGIATSMFVNEKGLAGSGDYPIERKRGKESDATRRVQPYVAPEPADPRYQGLMGGHIGRHIAETASSAWEALEIIEDFVEKGYYAGGNVGGQHWLFVDREGVVLEVSNNAEHVVHLDHSDRKAYFSRFVDRSAANTLRDAESVDFQLFRNVSRDPSILFNSSISGMTVEIDPEHPESLTCAWVALPARGVAFPILMGQRRTPAVLLDGSAYAAGCKASDERERWESMEEESHASKEALGERLREAAAEGDAEQVAKMAERWAEAQAEAIFKRLESPQ